MILTDTHKFTKRQLTFDSIEGGEVFFDPQNQSVYLKCHNVCYGDYNDEETEFNAIDLRDGTTTYFKPDEQVARFNEPPELLYSSEDVRYSE